MMKSFRSPLLVVAVVVCAAVLNQRADAQTYSVLYELTGGTDGSSPNDVIRDSARKPLRDKCRGHYGVRHRVQA